MHNSNTFAKQRGNGRRGFVLVAVALATLIMIGILGLCIDLGRMYIGKAELQAYADSAALAANKHLDGTDNGVALAINTASNYPNRWNVGSQAVSNVTVTFAKNVEGPYTATPPSPPTGYKYTRVDAQGALPLYFMPGFKSLNTPVGFLLVAGSQVSLQGDSLAAQLKVSRFSNNLMPYSPDAHLDPGRAPVYNPGSTTPDPFNFVVGKQYTLRWPPPGQRDKPNSWCGGDQEANFVTPSSSEQRGFIDIGDMPGSGGSAYIRDAIVNNVQAHPLEINDVIVNVSGNRGVESDALRERVQQDTDSYSPTWTAYTANRTGNNNLVGNGRRVVFIPVNNPWNGDRVVDFAAFFLPASSGICGTSNTAPCCAEYIGAGLLPGGKASSETIGVYQTRLLR